MPDMAVLWIGIALVASAVYAVLPVSWSPRWWPHVMNILRGGFPVLAVIVGVAAIYIGIADIKDRKEAKKEEEKSKTAGK